MVGQPSSFAEALRYLGLDGTAVPLVLADHPGRRVVARVGEVVVKAFADAERAAWEREVAGLRAVAGCPAAALGHGPLWTATRWIDGVVPLHASIDERLLHAMLGAALADLHRSPSSKLPAWRVGDRLRARLADPPPACPLNLAERTGQVVDPFLQYVTVGQFVHGDWGTANVLIRSESALDVIAILDFEDAHAGDHAEDFKWQVLAGANSEQFAAMATGYSEVGGDLGRHAVERLTLAGAELCLDVLGWELSADEAVRIHGKCIQTLEEIVSGSRPQWTGA